MDPNRPNFFAGPYIDRRAEARDEANWLETARADPGTLYLLGRGTAHLVRSAPEPTIAFFTHEHPLVREADPRQLVLLGWFREARCVLIDLGPDPAPPGAPSGNPGADSRAAGPPAAANRALDDFPGTSFQQLRELAPVLQVDESGLLSYARALAIWRARQRYCSVCGAPTEPIRAGHCMRCSNVHCGQEFFPRLDPAIIVLVTDGERALLGRQPGWPPGRYSTIAGFVEPGESLEDAVVREVLEETGVRVGEARYDSSQPWPFPASLMIGFQAIARPGSPVVVTGELEDARWFTREQIEEARAVLLPFSHSISYRLITTWLQSPR